ncbi:MAG TPA: hypothetical protein ENF21_03325 [Bacteroidetes bacterium]|nr:hypothetical protein [Bacteroidota bacterium]
MGRQYKTQIIVGLFSLLVFTALATWFFLTPGFFLYGSVSALLLVILSVWFYRFLLQTKRDLRQFLMSFDIEKSEASGTSRMLRHSKDDLNTAYHQILQALEKHINEKVGETQLLKEVFDHIDSGLIVINEFDQVVFLNRFTKNLLFYPDLKNMSGLARIDPHLAGVMKILEDNHRTRVMIMVENEPREFMIHLEIMEYKGSRLRVFTLNNIKREIRKSEQDAWNRVLQNLETRLKEDKFHLEQALSEFNQKIKYNRVKIIVSELFDNIIESSSSLFPEPAQVFHTRLSNIDLSVTADRSVIMSIFTELIKNAADALAGRSNPSITLHAELDLSCQVQLAIEDNGEGIVPEIRDWIFVPFFTTRKGRWGLGLSKARKWMDTMNGTIDVLGTPGAGTKFILRFM